MDIPFFFLPDGFSDFLHHVPLIASYVIPFLYILLSDFIFIFIFLVFVLYFKLLGVMGIH